MAQGSGSIQREWGPAQWVNRHFGYIMLLLHWAHWPFRVSLVMLYVLPSTCYSASEEHFLLRNVQFCPQVYPSHDALSDAGSICKAAWVCPLRKEQLLVSIGLSVRTLGHEETHELYLEKRRTAGATFRRQWHLLGGRPSSWAASGCSRPGANGRAGSPLNALCTYDSLQPCLV